MDLCSFGESLADIRGNGREVMLYLAISLISGPLIEAQVEANYVGTPVPASVMNPLVAAVAARAAKG